MQNCGSDETFLPVETNDELLQGAEAVLKNFQANAFEKNKPIWHLKAERAFLFSKKKEMQVFGLNMQYFKNGKLTTTITGKKAKLLTEKKRFYITGGVKAVSANGRVLKTESLTWRDSSKKLVSDSPVVITFPDGSTIHGRGLIADQRLDRIEILDGRGIRQSQ